MRPLLGLTQYCFGAVVLTLKATGCGLGLCTDNVRLTSIVSGPASGVNDRYHLSGPFIDDIIDDTHDGSLAGQRGRARRT